MPLCKWHTFWMAPCLICYFIVKLFYIERKWLLMRNLATILPLKSKLCGKFQRFIAIDRSIKILKNVEFQKNSIKMRNCKTFYEVQTAICLKEIIQPPPNPQPTFPHPHQTWNKCFLTEIYRNIQTFVFRVLQNAVLWRQ